MDTATSKTLTVLSWNVEGRTAASAERQLSEVLNLEPDVLALQEVVEWSLELWLDGLGSNDYSVEHSPIELLDVDGPFMEKTKQRPYRRNLNLIASKYPMTGLPGLSFPDPVEAFPEKYLAAQLAIDDKVVDIHNAHLPPGSTTGMIKVYAFEAIRHRIDKPTDAARILCGDFNTPRSEDDAGFETTAHRQSPDVQKRWDAAERGILEHPDLRDPYRAHHVAGTPFAVSHFANLRRVGRLYPRRYDHIYVSREFEMSNCRCKYLEPLLRSDVSDHAPVLATLRLS